MLKTCIDICIVVFAGCCEIYFEDGQAPAQVTRLRTQFKCQPLVNKSAELCCLSALRRKDAAVVCLTALTWAGRIDRADVSSSP